MFKENNPKATFVGVFMRSNKRKYEMIVWHPIRVGATSGVYVFLSIVVWQYFQIISGHKTD